ncbi:citrate lyase acyl carrier protein [Candidatus Epulonipiscium viviparus]|uniref:citrate lyase acyl carrier protein n=1 Tax=Candidatus Epulonipiscium viviparus TaxID=420336 RepID=UPI00016C085C|nr:citrate lyase acyl carrier protein [Candidatus Epulopiscium viviparus]
MEAMKLQETAAAGTLESSDIQIIIEPAKAGSGIKLDLQSAVMAQFGEQIEAVILETIKNLGVADAKVFANDKGAIDAVIISRVQTAIYRSAKTSTYKWF